jgi:hypothetical protein
MKSAIVCAVLILGAAAALSQPQAPNPGATGIAGANGGSGGRGGARVQPDPYDFNDQLANDHPGWTKLFDGTTLNGWDGNPDVWSVVDGAIVGAFKTPAGTRNAQTFLVWKGGEIANYELKLEIKLEGPTADSGIQYRAYVAPPGAGRAGAAPPAPTTGPDNSKWNLGGYQFDFNYPGPFDGQLAEAGTGARGIIAYRGQIVRAEEGKRPRIISQIGSMEALGGYFKNNDWNQVHLIARGNVLTQMINGHLMAMLIDEDPTKFKRGLQCAGSGTVTISFRNIWLRTLP